MISDANKITLQQMLSGRDASDEIFGWELSEMELQDQLDTYGFVYKCVVDNTSDPEQWLSFEGAVGRNAVAAIIGCHDSHLLSGTVTIAYPELGMSPNAQAAFVWMVVRHPQACNITELRVITRAPFLVSDAKSYNVRIVNYEGRQGLHGSTYYTPKCKKYVEEDHIRRTRKDPYFTKGQTFGMYMNFAADEKDEYGIYMGEDQYFVYWRRAGDFVIYRTEHKVIWYDLNAILLDKTDSSKVADMFFITDVNSVKLGDKIERRDDAEARRMIHEYLRSKK